MSTVVSWMPASVPAAAGKSAQKPGGVLPESCSSSVSTALSRVAAGSRRTASPRTSRRRSRCAACAAGTSRPARAATLTGIPAGGCRRRGPPRRARE
eukprot:1251656-Rhodomonas_salina.1